MTNKQSKLKEEAEYTIHTDIHVKNTKKYTKELDIARIEKMLTQPIESFLNENHHTDIAIEIKGVTKNDK